MKDIKRKIINGFCIDYLVQKSKSEKNGVISIYVIGEEINRCLPKKMILPNKIDGKNVVKISPWASEIKLDKVKELVLPKNTRVIGKNAFESMTYLETIFFPGPLQKIEEGAFADCISLKNITLENNIQVIEKDAFYGCERLKVVKIKGPIDKIGANAFGECDDLKQIYLEKDVEILEENALPNNEGLTIFAPSGGNAEKWAKKHNIKFEEYETIQNLIDNLKTNQNKEKF